MSFNISQRPTTRIVNLATPRTIGITSFGRARQPTLAKEASLLPNRNSTIACEDNQSIESRTVKAKVQSGILEMRK